MVGNPPGIYNMSRCRCQPRECPRCGQDLKAKRNSIGVCHISLDAHMLVCPVAVAEQPPPF